MKRLKAIIEYVLAFALLLALCFYVNRDIVIKALYMDDLFHWAWFRGLNIFEFAFKFYYVSRYRPVFDAIQYIFYMIIDTDPFRYAIINKVYNSIVALFIYHFIKRVDAGRVIAFLFSGLYLIAHFAYYQIGQGIGSLETDAQFFALVILFFSLKLSGAIAKKDEFGGIILPTERDNVRNTVALFIMFFIISFTHERFMGTAVPIVIAVLMSRDEDNMSISKRKIVSLLVFVLEILIICFIRFLAIGKVMPAGTGGTYVEETFNVFECIGYCFAQVACIFGINMGPEYLYGVDFFNLEGQKVKLLALVSIIIIAIVIVVYIYSRFKYKSRKNSMAGDLIFLSFIAMCIGASSVTIRVEMRFVYVSFTAAVIYLTYMCGFICGNVELERFKLVPIVLLVLVFVTRVPIELRYRTYFPKIHCYVDLKRVNSIYDSTIGKYGIDEILHKKKIYIVDNIYGMTEFYSEYFFKIYDRENVGNKIILVHDISEIPESDIGDDTIILYENYEDNDYKPLVNR